ncbi:MAG: ATP-binding protein [Candidatus Omnitrophica bacterium]|nr:ATP-binding protein [Candidatus Omnitrophota bacterium]
MIESLRKKIRKLVAAIILVFVVVSIFLAYVLGAVAVKKWEDRHVLREIAETSAAVTAVKRNLEETINFFIQGTHRVQCAWDGTQVKVISGLDGEMLRALGVDFVAIVRNSGQLFYERVAGSAGQDQSLPGTVRDYFQRQDNINRIVSSREGRSGMAVIGSDAYLMVSRPLWYETPQRVACGMLIIGKAVPKFKTKRDGYAVSFLNAPFSSPVSFGRPGAATEMFGTVSLVLQPRQEIVAQVRIDDFLGKVPLVAQITAPRRLWPKAGFALLLLCGIIFILAGIAGWLVAKKYEQLVLGRVEAINRVLMTIRRVKNIGLRVPDTGNDEISELGAGINVVMQLLQEDIAQRMRTEKELALACQKLQETQRELIQSGKLAAMGQLAAGISHELNQPLTGIKGFSQVILSELPDDDPHRDDLVRIIEQADRMDRIIQNVRMFARKSEFEKRPLDIHDPLEKALSLIAQQLTVHNIQVVRELGDVPPILGDMNSLQQVFVNLLTNARDAVDSARRPEGGVITVKSALSSDGKKVEISVSDNGCGIPAENLDHVFNPFFTTKSPHGGMGLGLSIVYRIVEDHRGVIRVSSQVHTGTTFTIILPTQEAAVVSAQVCA